MKSRDAKAVFVPVDLPVISNARQTDASRNKSGKNLAL
jgi:hypothetical protein